MSKNTKILLVLLAIVAILVLYLVLSSEKIVIFNAEPKQEKEVEEIIKISPEEILTNYTQGMELFFSDLENLTEENLTAPQLLEAKEKLLSLTVPGEYKAFHLDLVLAIDSLTDYLDEENTGMISDALESAKSMREKITK